MEELRTQVEYQPANDPPDLSQAVAQEIANRFQEPVYLIRKRFKNGVKEIIIRLERGGLQGPVTVSTSTDDSLSDFEAHDYPFDQIVFPDNAEGFIHVPTSPDESPEDADTALRYSLADIGVNVSTGPVVDFRLRDYFREGKCLPYLRT